MQNSTTTKMNSKVVWLLVGCLSVFLLLAWGASAAPPAPAAPAAQEEVSFLDRIRSKLPDNPFGMSDEEKLEIVREYNAGTAAAGQQARANAAKAQRDAAAAAEAKGKYETSLRALRMCVAQATNR